jgi:ABC-type polysaccharide/polyol phosphate transport system ATPase subunit
MSGSDRESPAAPFEVILGDEGPRVELQGVSRVYAPLPFSIVHRLFSVFGGIEKNVRASELGDDEEDDEEEGAEIEGLSEHIVAVDEVSLRIHGSGCVAFIGPRDSGKTVLLRVIAGLAPPTRGKIETHGLLAPVMTSALGAIPQYGKLRRVLPIYACFLGLSMPMVKRHLPAVYDFLGGQHLAREPVRHFAGAKRRALAFALMLAVDPDILIVDCPLPDGRMGEAVQERVLELKRQGSLILLVAASAREAAWIADHVVYMDEGRITGTREIGDALASGAPAGADVPDQVEPSFT